MPVDVDVAVGVAVLVGVAVGVLVGVAVAHTQFVLEVQLAFRQRPLEQISPDGHWLLDVHVVLHCGTAVAVAVGFAVFVGVAVGVGDDVVIVNERLQAIGVAAAGWLDGAFGATAVFLV